MYRQLIFALIFLVSVIPMLAQNSALTPDEIAKYQEDVGYLVSYFEGTLNFLGDPTEVAAEKDIILNESYLKIFKNPEIQIEDDLDERRETPLNKNVQAYLKDVIFFYKKVNFTFHITSVEQQLNQNDQVYFKVTTNRNLEGITVAGDSVSSNLVRYFEINLDQQNKDLKIVSIYTTKLNEMEEMKYWWNNMSSSWKQVFGRSVLVYDTLPFMNILSFNDSSLVTYKWIEDPDTSNTWISVDTLMTEQMGDSLFTHLETRRPLIQVPDTITVDPSTIYRLLRAFRLQKKISISHNHVLRNLEPLAELTELRELDMSHTLIGDLSPIRNLNKLEILNLEGSAVSSLDAIRYLTSLKELNGASTQISSLEVLANLPQLLDLDLQSTPFEESEPLSNLINLKHLNLKSTKPNNYHGLSGLKSLTDLNLSSSSITHLNDLSSLENLQNLNIDSTRVTQLSPLSQLTALSILQANYTPVSDILPLQNNPELRAIYCDNSKITMQKATEFMDKKPGCLVVYNSQNLLTWWNDLSQEWKNIFKKSYQLAEPLTKEQLHQLMSRETLSLAYNQQIDDIQSLTMLHRLENLNLEHTRISDLSPLAGLNNLKVLNINNTPIISLEPLSGMQNLKTLKANQSEINNLMPLTGNGNMNTIWCENTKVSEDNVLEFRKIIPSCVVVYQTEKLRMWWNYMSETWRNAFRKQLMVPESPSDIELQQLANLTRFEISNNPDIHELTPLNILFCLQTLSISNAGVSNLNPITGLHNLTQLSVVQNPVTDISMLGKMTGLTELNLSETPVEDLEGLKNLTNLISLNLSGTRIRSLKDLRNLNQLQILSISNTRIRNLKHLSGLNNLTTLNCFNTGLKESKVDSFKEQHPEAEVVYY